MEGFARGLEAVFELFRLALLVLTFLLPLSFCALIAAGLWYFQLPNAASIMLLVGTALGIVGICITRRLLPL